jgi:hypothetical protein
VLIKKKDVDDYFAGRRGRHRLSPKQTTAVTATESSIAKRANKSSSLAAPIKAPGTRASTQDLSVPFFTSELGFIAPPPPVVKRRTNS